jgi:hypothetical protein
MTFEILKFKLDLTKRKIKATSLFNHQALKTLLKQNEKKINVKANNKNDKEEIIRQLIAEVRRNDGDFHTWSSATRQKYPHLETLCNNACVLNYRIMICNFGQSETFEFQHIDTFWEKLFDHYLKLSFVNPQCFIDSYPLWQSIDIFKNSLDDFIDTHVKLDCEKPSLTQFDIDELQKELQTQEHKYRSKPCKNQRSRESSIIESSVNESSVHESSVKEDRQLLSVRLS